MLIFTGWTIGTTHYVTDHQFAGSTHYSSVCCRYISSLAVGGTDDLGWMTFDIGPGSTSLSDSTESLGRIVSDNS